MDAKSITCRRAAAVAVLALLLLVPGSAFADPGDLDPGFGSDGIVVTDFAGTYVATAVAFDSGGHVVVAGGTGYDTVDMAVLRLLADGSFDAEFSNDGFVAIDFAGRSDRGADLVIDDQGRILMVGESSDGVSGEIAVARLLPDGRRDASFGNGGAARIGLDAGPTSANAVVLSDDGGAYVVGSTDIGTEQGFDLQQIAVIRLRADGTIDTDFGNGGIATITGPTDSASGNAIAVDRREGIWIAGNVMTLPDPDVSELSDSDFALFRLEADGRVDTSFGDGGFVAIDSSSSDTATDLVIDERGRVVVVGTSLEEFEAEEAELMRFLPDGALDSTFGSDGTVVVALGDDDASKTGSSLALDSNGDIVIAGRTDASQFPATQEGDFLVARYRPDGSPDEDFGENGVATVDFDGGDDTARALAIDTDGTIVVGGMTWPQNSSEAAVALARIEGIPRGLLRFIDIEESVFQHDIESIAATGITRGCNPPANYLYCPDAPVTRGQMAAFLVRALDLTDDGGGNLFADDDTSIFQTDIDTIATARITLGCNPPTNDRYCPDQPVTRGQMAAFLARALTNVATG